MKICKECGSNYLVELHHIIFRGQAPALINCKYNLIPLCYDHHRGTYGPHGSKGHKLDQKLKKEFQDSLRLIFGADINYSIKQIKEKLDISLEDTERLIKTLLPVEGKYKGIDIIRAAMGGKLILWR
mgnify:CR=1 FL=1